MITTSIIRIYYAGVFSGQVSDSYGVQRREHGVARDRVRNTTRVLRHDVQTALPRVNPRKQVYMFFLFLACFCSVTSQYRELINQVWFSFPDRIYSTTASGDEQIIQTTETASGGQSFIRTMRGERQSKIMEIYFSKGEILGEGGRQKKDNFLRSCFRLRCRSPLTRALHIFSLKGKIRDYSQFTNKRVKNPNWQEANQLAIQKLCLAPGIVKDLNMGLTASGQEGNSGSPDCKSSVQTTRPRCPLVDF